MQAALVSILTSTIVTFLIVLVIEPQKWRTRYGIRTLEKALEAYGWLISILSACQQKAKRRAEEGKEPAPHYLESSDIWTLEKIFGNKAYLLSDRLKQTWSELQKSDTYFGMMNVKHRKRIKLATLPGMLTSPPEMRHEIMPADLAKMQQQAEADMAELQKRYQAMTGFNPLR